MNEESKEVEKHFIGVKTRIDSDAEFFFFEEMKHGHDIKHNSIRSDEIEAKVILISDPLKTMRTMKSISITMRRNKDGHARCLKVLGSLLVHQKYGER